MNNKRLTLRAILRQTPENEGKLLIGNFGQKPSNVLSLPKAEDRGSYLKLMEQAQRGIYSTDFPRRVMTLKEHLAIDSRIEKLTDIIAEDYDEDLTEDSKREANYLQKLVQNSEKF